MGVVEGVGKKCATDEGLAQEGPYQVEENQLVNGNRSYNLKPNNIFLTCYTPILRHHENFYYGGGM